MNSDIFITFYNCVRSNQYMQFLLTYLTAEWYEVPRVQYNLDKKQFSVTHTLTPYLNEKENKLVNNTYVKDTFFISRFYMIDFDPLKGTLIFPKSKGDKTVVDVMIEQFEDRQYGYQLTRKLEKLN